MLTTLVLRYRGPVTTAMLASPDAERRARRLLRLDSTAGLLAGLLMLVSHEWLAALTGMPVPVVLFVAVANLVYGSYSGWLVTTAQRRGLPSRRVVTVLIVANVAWAVVCAALLARFGASATVFGWLHLVLEGVFVAALGLVEWRVVRPLTHVS